MSKTIVLNSFDGLRAALTQTGTEEELPASRLPDEAYQTANDAVIELRSELERAAATLAEIAQRDREAREQALNDLASYDRMVADLREASSACRTAERLRKQAESLALHAFDEEAKQAAAEAAATPRRIEEEARRLVDVLRDELAKMQDLLDIERLLKERRRLEMAEQARAAKADLARRLSEALAQARGALERERFEEARAALGPVTNENPGSAEAASLMENIARREQEVKVALAEEALWLADRDYRFEPAAAVKRLGTVDTSALPEPVARQVFGVWARACLQLCRRRGLHEPVRFGGGAGRGVAFARETPGAPYVVLSAIGMRERWEPGALAPDEFVKYALPLDRHTSQADE